MFSRWGARAAGDGGTPAFSRGSAEFASRRQGGAGPRPARPPGRVSAFAAALLVLATAAAGQGRPPVETATDGRETPGPAADGAVAVAPAGAYGRLLARHVRPGRIGEVALNVVDYAALARDPDYAAALREFETADPDRLPGEADRFAFWINAYNLLAIRTVVDHYPIAGIRDAGSFLFPVWKRQAGTVAGRPRTLDEVEHGILRPRFRDPRVHFAIVCASVSCPDLRSEPYEGRVLDAQLDDAARRFVGNPAKGVSLGARPRVSSIFRWFAEDFGPAGIVAFVRPRMEPQGALRLNDLRDADLGWLDYDWSLNDAARSRP